MYIVPSILNYIVCSTKILTGADIIGINCRFDPETCVETTIRMRAAVEKAGMKCHYMVQPLAYRTADAGRLGFIELPECPFGTYKVLKKSHSPNSLCFSLIFSIYFGFKVFLKKIFFLPIVLACVK